MGKNSNVNNKNSTRMAGPVTERLTALEKRFSTVMVHQTYFKIMDEWLQCMFGAQLFPNPEDLKIVEEEELNDDNPFYEFHVLAQRISFLEERLEQLGFPVPTPAANARNTRGAFKAPAPPPATTKSAVKRPYPVAPPTTIRRRSNQSKNSSETQAVRVPVAAKKATSVVPKSPASTSNKVAAASNSKIKDVSTKQDDAPVSPDAEKASELKPEGETKPSETESKPAEDEVEKPPVLEQESSEKEDAIKIEDPNPDMDVVDGTIAEGVPPEVDMRDLEDMEVDEDEEEYDEDEDDVKPLVPTPEELAAGGLPTLGRPRGSKNVKKPPNITADVVTIEDDQPVVTYTTRGRRHTLPRRYAEYTGHDNVASILKSQQRAAASTQASKVKKTPQSQEKIKTPTKPKTTAPKVTTPKKPPADGSRPECVYDCIGRVQTKDVDDDGDVVLWDTYPDVKVNLQQLISVIFRSNGMSTRLTRKMTTLVFEDQVLANASPFGTKYYQERLPPNRLEAMVEFIAASGFDPEYTKKKIYMIVGQVCNEARAGRVRKLVPQTEQPEPDEEPIA